MRGMTQLTADYELTVLDSAPNWTFSKIGSWTLRVSAAFLATSFCLAVGTSDSLGKYLTTEVLKTDRNCNGVLFPLNFLLDVS